MNLLTALKVFLWIIGFAWGAVITAGLILAVLEFRADRKRKAANPAVFAFTHEEPQ